MCIKRVFSAKYCVSAHLTSFLLKNACKQKEMLVLALVGLILHNLLRLQVSQSVHCVETDNMHKTRFLAQNTAFQRIQRRFCSKNEFKRKEMLVLPLVSLILHNSTRLHVSQCFYCVKTDNVQKTRFYRKITRFSAFNVVFAEKRL